MQTIYIDPITFQCHTSQNAEGGYIQHETDFFNDKCETFIQGYQIIPSGYSWTSSDGTVFRGEMVAPWKSYSELDAVQRKYERQKLAEYNQVLQELGVEV